MGRMPSDHTSIPGLEFEEKASRPSPDATNYRQARVVTLEPNRFDFSFWETNLDGIINMRDGIKGMCPAHDDTKASLHVTRAHDGGAVIHCFAGCSYSDIIAAVTGEVPIPAPRRIKRVDARTGHVIPDSGLEWLAKYTNVSHEWLTTDSDLPLREEEGVIVFEFGDLPIVKVRKVGEKEFKWFPEGAVAPPFWPVPPDELDETICLTEGETDCIVLRFMYEIGSFDLTGDIFALTKGANTKPSAVYLQAFKRAGVRHIILAFDEDEAGHKATAAFTDAAVLLGIRVSALRPNLRVLQGEKDLRDWYSRDRGSHVLSLDQHARLGISIDALEERSGTEVDWIVPGYFARGAITLLAGYPKAGKSSLLAWFLACHERGDVFLGEPTSRGRALLMTEEFDPTIILKMRAFDVRDLAVVTLADSAQAGLDFAGAIESAVAQAQNEGRDTIVIDTLSAWATFKDENDAAEITRVIATVRTAVAGTGLCVILVHHMRKGGGEYGEAIRGSSALFALTEVAIEYAHKDRVTRSLVVTSRFPDAPDPLFVRLEDGRFDVLDRKEWDLTEAQPVLDALAESPMTIKELAEATGLGEGVIRNHMYRLEELQQVEVETGKYGRKTYTLIGNPSPIKVKVVRSHKS